MSSILTLQATAATKAEPFGFSADDMVKIASAGVAGVSVLAMLIIGTVLVISKTISPIKADLMKSFMKFCLGLAVIVGGSGVALAYNNNNKVQSATTAAEEASEKAQLVLTCNS